jgi:hypothetical protein
MNSIDSQRIGPRSNFVTVTGWIFAILAGGVSAISLLQNVMFHTLFRTDPAFDALASNKEELDQFQWMMKAMPWLMGLVFVASITTLTAAIGLIRRIEWARRIFLAMLALMILWQIGGLVHALWFMGKMDAHLDAAPADIGRAFRTMQALMVGATIVFGVLVSSLLAWLAWRLTRPEIRAEFVDGDRGSR